MMSITSSASRSASGSVSNAVAVAASLAIEEIVAVLHDCHLVVLLACEFVYN